MMRQRLTKRVRLWRDTRGISAVEFAIVVPILLMMLGGIIDLGNYYLLSSKVTGAAEVGARMAAVGTTTADVISKLQTEDSAYQVNVTSNSANSTVTVTVQLPVTFSFPVISAFFPSNPTVTGSCTMYDETAS